MSANGNSNGAPFKITLRDLPLPVRLVLSLFLIGVVAGYFSALVQLHFQNATRGQPLPTPNDVVEIFSGVEGWPTPKPAPPRPMSKLEALIMGPEDVDLKPGATSMGKAFFMGDPDYRKKVEKDPASEPRLHELRQGDRLGLQAWINLPDDQRRQAFEDNDMELPAAIAAHPITHQDPNHHLHVQELIQDRCGKCHAAEGQLGNKVLKEYDDFRDVLVVPPVGHTSRQMSTESLAQTTHLHLLSFCMLWMLTGAIFAFSSYWKWLRCIVAPLVLLAQIADVSFWWLARLTGPYQILGWTLPLPNPIGPYFALGIIGTGALVGLGLLLQIVLSLWDMYRWSGRMVLLVLAIALASGAAVLTPRVQDYLRSETAPPASAPVTPPEPAEK